MMSLTQKIGGVVAFTSAALSFSVLNANLASAATFNFSYTFLSGETISGSVDGDIAEDGDTVTNLSNLVAEYSGVPGTVFSFFVPPLFGERPFTLSGIGLELYGFVNNPDTPSFNSNLGFYLTNRVFSNSATLGNFFTRSDSIGFPSATNAREFETFSVSRWQAAQASDVPEGSAVLGLAVLGLGLLSKKKLTKVAKS